MRSILTHLVASIVLTLAAAVSAPNPGQANTVINVCGKFTFWVPDDWKATKDSDNIARTTFDSSGTGDLSVVAGPLSDLNADITDAEEVTDFADEELDEMKVTSDKNDTLQKFKVRLITGTGMDDGDNVVFRMLALDPGPGSPVIAVMVSGAPEQMAKAENQQVIDKILQSLRPQ